MFFGQKRIIENKNLIATLNQTKQISEHSTSSIKANINPVADEPMDDFRKKFPTQWRTKDGHWVRSRAEVIIDNALYDYQLAHAYERKLPIEVDVYCDFYLPSQKVYIEYWGLENDPKYQARKAAKLEIYKKHDFKLIELSDADISNLDDHLPKKLLKFGIKVY